MTRTLLQQALDAFLTGYHQGTQDAIAALREALAPDHLRDVAEKVADPWREAVLDRLAVLCMDAPQDEPPASILRRIVAAEVEIALDPRVSDVAPDGMVMVPREPTEEMIQAAAGAWGESESGLHNAFAAALRGGIAAAPAAPVVPDLKHCACEFDGDTCVTQCKLHAAHVDAIHEWAERAKAAEANMLAAPVVREPLRDDAFHAWVEEASADHPNLLERQEFRDAMYNAWINGYNTRVDEQANGITGGKP